MAGSRESVVEVIKVKQVLKTTTHATGSSWVQAGNANAAGAAALACASIKVLNNTGTELSFGFGAIADTAPTGETYEIPTGCSDVFYGLTHNKQLFVRRSDVSGTQKTFKSIAYL